MTTSSSFAHPLSHRRTRLAACCMLCATAAIAVAATGASAGGISIGWNDCASASTSSNRNFACNSSSGSNALVASFDPPEGITQLVGCSALIGLRAAQTIPSWWQMSAGDCRFDAVHVALGPGPGSCTDPWQGAGSGTFTYQGSVDGNQGLARINVSCAIPESQGGPLETGTEYTAFRLIIDNTHTVGAGSCTGCLDPMCIGLISIWLYQPVGVGDYEVCNYLLNGLVTWQGGGIGAIGCPGTDQSPPPFPWGCGATPTLNRTWGQLKSLYR